MKIQDQERFHKLCYVSKSLDIHRHYANTTKCFVLKNFSIAYDVLDDTTAFTTIIMQGLPNQQCRE